MTVRYQYVFPIPESDDVFDEMVRDACAIEWGDPETQRNGRSGQSQNGVDVFGYPHESGGRCRAAQSKLRAKGKPLTKGEIHKEVANARSSPLNLEQLIIVTSTGRDADLQAYVDQISRAQMQNSSFPVKIWFWDDLLERLLIDRRFILKYYKDLLASVTNLAEAEALIDRPIFVLIETCGDTSDDPELLKEALRMRGMSTSSDRNAALVNGYGPDGVVCFYPRVAAVKDDLAMQKYTSTVKSYENGDCPVFAIVPPEFIAKFYEFYRRENGRIDHVSVQPLNQGLTLIVKPIFYGLLTYGYRRRGALPVIDVSCRSMGTLPKSALLDLDWSPEFNRGVDWPDQVLWDAKFLPVIQDVINGLVSLGKNIHLHYDCRLFLPLALALGYFSNIRLCKASVWARQANDSPFTQRFWDSDVEPASISVSGEEINRSGGQSKNMIVEISSQADIHADVQEYIERTKLLYGKWLKIDLMEHSRQGIPLDATYSVAYAEQVGRLIRQHKGGHTNIHLFISTLSPLAFLIGQRLQACGRVHLYWYTNPSYREAFILQ
jgi:hypothetical protein